MKRKAASTPGTSSSCSSAATIGSARTSFRKAATPECAPRGIDAFRKIGAAHCFRSIATRANAITDWDHVKLLTVVVDRLKTWAKPGFLCIGDAAHAMSPVGGVGVNLAVQDAVAAANRLWQPLKEGNLQFSDLQAVQSRREFPTVATQRLQLGIQNMVISKTLTATGPIKPPLFVRLVSALPFLSRFPGTAVGPWLSSRACGRAHQSVERRAKLSRAPSLHPRAHPFLRSVDCDGVLPRSASTFSMCREAADEFLVRAAQRVLGVDLQMPRDVRHHEQDVSELFFDGGF